MEAPPRLLRLAELAELAEGRLAVAADLGDHWGRTLPERVAGCARALLASGSAASDEAAVFMVPGRIEVLGKHTDYAGGRSLLAAVERGFVFVAIPRRDGRTRLLALDPGEDADFVAGPELAPGAGWRNYAMTVARRLARDFPGVARGTTVAMSSDLPAASGMSSSSALIIGTFLCLAHAGGLFDDDRFRAAIRTPDDLAAYLAAVESGAGFGPFPGDAGVGTHGGSEDHTAILLGRPGELLQYGFIPPLLERAVPLPEGLVFAIASSGIQAEKTGAMRERYNRASALVRTLRGILATEEGREVSSLAAALRSSPDAAERLRAAVTRLPDLSFPQGDLLLRLDQFRQESEEILPAAAAALLAGDLARFGELVDRSQRLAESHLGNQIPETISLARSARRLGAIAGSAFGAGYGGSVWALVEAGHAGTFLDAWRASYDHPGAQFFLSRPGPGARRLA